MRVFSNPNVLRVYALVELGDTRAYLGSPQSRKVTFGNSC